MVLTGKQALDYAGGVSAEDNFGIGGYDRIMGPNGQAQYWAPDLAGACARAAALLRARLRRARRALPAPRPSTERRARPRRALLAALRARLGARDRRRRSSRTRRTRAASSRSTSARSCARSSDDDHPPLERWARMRDAEAAVVWDAHLGGWPVGLIGIESHPIDRFGPVPADGPAQWTSGTLFPMSSKKVARAINAIGGRRPVVVLANLAGFDGSPESMRQLAARVRRGDRPGDRQLPRPDRVLRDLALPRRRVRGLLAAAERRASRPSRWRARRPR